MSMATRRITDQPAADSPSGSSSRPSSSAKPSVIFVREWDQQLASSGCCGRVEGDFLGKSTLREEVFSERRACMEEVGRLYRALRDRFGDDVQVQILDPRNLFSLVPILWREGRRYDVPVLERLSAIVRVSVNMVIVNGRIVARTDWPSPSELVEQVADRVSTAPRRA